MGFLSSVENSFSKILISHECITKFDMFWGPNQVLSVSVQGKSWGYFESLWIMLTQKGK